MVSDNLFIRLGLLGPLPCSFFSNPFLLTSSSIPPECGQKGDLQALQWASVVNGEILRDVYHGISLAWDIGILIRMALDLYPVQFYGMEKSCFEAKKRMFITTTYPTAKNNGNNDH